MAALRSGTPACAGTCYVHRSTVFTPFHGQRYHKSIEVVPKDYRDEHLTDVIKAT